MKTLVILGLFFAYVQATSEPQTVKELIRLTLTKCAQEKNLDLLKMHTIMSKPILPLDNPELLEFFPCYWREFGILKSDGTFDDDQIERLFTELMGETFENVENPEKLVKDAVSHCKPKIHGDSPAVKGISYRNCLMQHVSDAEE